jgi:hypothetical protein
VKVALIIESVCGRIIEPATPMRARQAISIAMEVDSAAARDARANMIRPSWNMRLRP